MSTSHLPNIAGLIVKEGKRRILLMSSILSAVALIALVVAMIMPKRYDASALLVVDKPMMEGGHSGNEQAAITMQVMEGHKIPRELLLYGGWVQPPPAKQPDPREEARLVTKLRAHIKIDSPKEGMIRIAYNDSDPERTYKIANKVAEIYVRESGEAQQRDSREAFEFIDAQVKEYAEKLATYHQQVLAHYRHQDGPPDPKEKPAGPTPTTNPAPRPVVPGPLIRPEELAALRAEKAQLETQLATKPPPPPVVDTRAEDQLRAKISAGQSELDRLLATYTDQHPDVKRVKRELAATKEELRVLEAARAQKNDSQSAASAAQADEEMRRAARIRLDEVNRKIALATNTPVPPPTPAGARAPRPGESAGLAGVAAPVVDPELRGIGQDTTLAELLRKYEATRDAYEGLLKRREKARVELELAKQRGSTMRIQEPAELPVNASGLRVSHYCAVGLVLAVLIPIGILFGIVRLDKRVRSPQQIEFVSRVPLLVSISAPPVDKEKSKQRMRHVLAVLMIVGVFVVYVTVFVLKTRASS